MRDHTGKWHDAPARSLELGPGEESKPHGLTWKIPEDPAPPHGSYEIVVAMWTQRPGTDGARRLTDATRRNAFQVVSAGFSSPSKRFWEASSSKLGCGSLKPENVQTESGHLKIKLPAGTLDGGEKVADAPSSITGFFLYKAPDFENEIDGELYNDDSRRILLTTYSQTNTVRKVLPFDPTKELHEYRFDYYPHRTDFHVDGRLLHGFDQGLPADPMNLYVNAWFPAWLSGEKLHRHGYTYVDWIQH